MSVVIELEHVNDICIVRMHGRIMVGSDSGYLYRMSEKIKNQEHYNLLIDLTGLPFVDSIGLGFLIGLYTSFTNEGGRFVMMGLSDRVRSTLELTRLKDVLPVATDENTALQSLRAQAASA